MFYPSKLWSHLSLRNVSLAVETASVGSQIVLALVVPIRSAVMPAVAPTRAAARSNQEDLIFLIISDVLCPSTRGT